MDNCIAELIERFLIYLNDAAPNAYCVNEPYLRYLPTSVTRRKSQNVYKSCPKLITQENWKILTPLQNLPKNVGDLGKLNVAKGFKKLPKIQKIAKSGHTATHVQFEI